MNNRARFRAVIVGALIYELIIAAALLYFDNGQLDAAWDMLPQTSHWSINLTSNGSVLLMVFAGLAILSILCSIIGVLLFKNWGRWLYFLSTVLALPISVLTGPSIYFGWEIMLWDSANMLHGAIIIAMFLPPIANEFNA